MVIDTLVWDICKVSLTPGHVYTSKNTVSPSAWQMGAGQLEQKYGPDTVLGARVLPSPHPGHLGGHSHGAADTQVAIREN